MRLYDALQMCTSPYSSAGIGPKRNEICRTVRSQGACNQSRRLPSPPAQSTGVLAKTDYRFAAILRPVQKVFLLAQLRLFFQAVSIRSVSTKLKVNWAEQIPQPPSLKRSHADTHGIDPLDGFQVNLATIRPLNKHKGYRQALLL